MTDKLEFCNVHIIMKDKVPCLSIESTVEYK